jgi:hypothetical protein
LAVRTGGVDLILAGIESQAFSETDGVGSRDWGTQTLNGRKYLLEQVKLNIRLEA